MRAFFPGACKKVSPILFGLDSLLRTKLHYDENFFITFFTTFFGTFKKTFEILNRNIWHHYNIILWLLQFCKKIPINTSTLICDYFCFHVHIFSKPTSCQFTFFYQLDWAYVVCFDRIFAPFCDTILTSVRTEKNTCWLVWKISQYRISVKRFIVPYNHKILYRSTLKKKPRCQNMAAYFLQDIRERSHNSPSSCLLPV